MFLYCFRYLFLIFCSIRRLFIKVDGRQGNHCTSLLVHPTFYTNDDSNNSTKYSQPNLLLERRGHRTIIEYLLFKVFYILLPFCKFNKVSTVKCILFCSNPFSRKYVIYTYK